MGIDFQLVEIHENWNEIGLEHDYNGFSKPQKTVSRLNLDNPYARGLPQTQSKKILCMFLQTP